MGGYGNQANPMRSAIVSPITKAALAVLGFAWIAFLLLSHRSELDSLGALEAHTFIFLLTLMTATNAAAAVAWATLMSEGGPHQFLAYLASVPARYLPGGVGQPIAQTANAARAAEDIPRVGIRMVQHIVLSIGTGGLLALLGSLFSPVPRLAMLGVAVCAGAGFIASYPPVVLWLWSGVLRRKTTLEPAPFPRVLRAALWTAIGLVTMTAGFWLALADARGPFLAVGTGFLLAWTAGYMSFLVPGGLGVRESALLVFVSGPTGAVVAGSVLLRIVGLLADLLVGIGGKVGLSRMRSGRNPDETSEASRIASAP